MSLMRLGFGLSPSAIDYKDLSVSRKSQKNLSVRRDVIRKDFLDKWFS